MENQLALLITLYEEERKKLAILINECLEDFEGPAYILANNHQKALYIAENTIRVLKGFEDDDYDDKQHCITLIEKFEKDLKEADSENSKIWFSQLIKVQKEKLKKLNSIITVPKSENHSAILETALNDLVCKRIKKFKIIFNKSQRISLKLSTKNRFIKIASSIIKKETMRDFDLNLLQNLGFELINKNKLVFQLENKGDESLIRLKYILTKIVFDVSYYKHPATENFIEL